MPKNPGEDEIDGDLDASAHRTNNGEPIADAEGECVHKPAPERMDDRTELVLSVVFMHEARGNSIRVPLLIVDAGERAAWMTLTFFSTHLSNHTVRRAYGSIVWRFCEWCRGKGIALNKITPPTIAAYLAGKEHTMELASIAFTASAIRRWLATVAQ